MYLLYLDDTDLDDPVFAGSLAQRMRRAASLPSLAFVHGSGGMAERLLEAEGLFPVVQDGVLKAVTPQEIILVERGLRTQNRRLVATLTEESVPAVGIQGGDRGLLRRSASGTVELGNGEWLRRLVAQGAVPVVSALVRDAGTASLRQAALPDVALALAQRLGMSLVLLAASALPGRLQGAHRLTDLPAHLLPDPAILKAATRAGVPLQCTDPDRFFLSDVPFDARVTALLP